MITVIVNVLKKKALSDFFHVSCTYRVFTPLMVSKDANNPFTGTVVGYKNDINDSPCLYLHSLPCDFLSPTYCDSVLPAEDLQGHLAASKLQTPEELQARTAKPVTCIQTHERQTLADLHG